MPALIGSSIAGALALALAPPPSEPQPAVTVEWTADVPGCPSEAVLKREIARWVGAGRMPQTSVDARGQVEREAGGDLRLRVRIETSDGVLEQDATARRCVDLADAFALQVAMAIDPARIGELSSTQTLLDGEAETETEIETEIQAQPTSDLDPEVENEPSAPRTLEASPPRAARRLRGSVWLEGGAGGRHVPRVDGRLGAGGSLLLPSARLDLGYVHTFEQRQRHPSLVGVGVDVRHLGAVVRGCWRPVLATFELPVCGGVEIGAHSAEGFGIERIRRGRGLSLSATARAGAQWVPIRWLAIGVAIEGYVALLRSGVSLADLAPLFEPSIIGGWGLVRVEARFP